MLKIKKGERSTSYIFDYPCPDLRTSCPSDNQNLCLVGDAFGEDIKKMVFSTAGAWRILFVLRLQQKSGAKSLLVDFFSQLNNNNFCHEYLY